MRLSLRLNGAPLVTALVEGPGFLGAHLNMHDLPKDNDYSSTLRVTGSQTFETETVRLEWPTCDLRIGDVVEIRVLADGEGDPASAVRRSSQAPSNLFSSIDLAKELLKVISDYEARLMELVKKSEKTEPADEHEKFVKAVGAVASEHGMRLIYPVYRRHKELIPDDLKGELL